jgi:hypothetical protein
MILWGQLEVPPSQRFRSPTRSGRTHRLVLQMRGRFVRASRQISPRCRAAVAGTCDRWRPGGSHSKRIEPAELNVKAAKPGFCANCAPAR